MKLVVQKNVKKKKIEYYLFDEETNRREIMPSTINEEYIKKLRKEFGEYVGDRLTSNCFQITFTCSLENSQEEHNKIQSVLNTIANGLMDNEISIPCFKCGGKTVMARFTSSEVYVLFVKNELENISSVGLRVCTKCGHVEMYATNPKKLL